MLLYRHFFVLSLIEHEPLDMNYGRLLVATW